MRHTRPPLATHSPLLLSIESSQVQPVSGLAYQIRADALASRGLNHVQVADIGPTTVRRLMTRLFGDSTST